MILLKVMEIVNIIIDNESNAMIVTDTICFDEKLENKTIAGLNSYLYHYLVFF